MCYWTVLLPRHRPWYLEPFFVIFSILFPKKVQSLSVTYDHLGVKTSILFIGVDQHVLGVRRDRRNQHWRLSWDGVVPRGPGRVETVRGLRDGDGTMGSSLSNRSRNMVSPPDGYVSGRTPLRSLVTPSETLSPLFPGGLFCVGPLWMKVL